jgi:hypothetical protein
MAHKMHRTQILLEPEQHEVLGEIARHEGRSISEVVRDILRENLPRRTAALRRRREIEAIQELSRIRAGAAQRHGIIDVDLVAEARADREKQLDAALHEEGQS